MNKSDLVNKLADKCDIGAAQSEDILNLIFDSMKDVLGASKRIEIRGFGSFVVKEYKARWGRNPKSGEKIWVKEKKLPAFKLGKELNERLNAVKSDSESQTAF